MNFGRQKWKEKYSQHQNEKNKVSLKFFCRNKEGNDSFEVKYQPLVNSNSTREREFSNKENDDERRLRVRQESQSEILRQTSKYFESQLCGLDRRRIDRTKWIERPGVKKTKGRGENTGRRWVFFFSVLVHWYYWKYLKT